LIADSLKRVRILRRAPPEIRHSVRIFGSLLPRKLFGKSHPSERSRHNPAPRCCTYRREMVDLNADLCALPVDLRAIVLSHVEHVKTRQILALSSTFREAFSLPGALPRTFDFEGVAGDDIADQLVRLLDDDRVRSLEKERALELIGVHKDRLCEYACVQRNFEVLKWARNELDLPWALYPAGHVSDDVLVLRVLRETWPTLKRYWRMDAGPEEWRGVTMENGRVVKLELTEVGLTGAVPAEVGRLGALRVLWLSFNKLTSVPAEIGQLTSLRKLILSENQLTSLPAWIGQLTSLTEWSLRGNQLTSVPAWIGQLTSLTRLDLGGNQLTSVPAEIGQLAALKRLWLSGNKLTSVPAEIGQLTSLVELRLDDNRLTSVPAEIGQLTSLVELRLDDNRLTSLPAEIGQLTSLVELLLYGNRLTSLPAEIGQLTSLERLSLNYNLLTSLPAEIGQLTSLTELYVGSNQLTSVPAEIGQLTALKSVNLGANQLTSLPAAIRELMAAGCHVRTDGVTIDE